MSAWYGCAAPDLNYCLVLKPIAAQGFSQFRARYEFVSALGDDVGGAVASLNLRFEDILVCTLGAIHNPCLLIAMSTIQTAFFPTCFTLF